MTGDSPSAIAVQTEGRASVRVKTFATSVADPLLRSALEMDAGEEARHKIESMPRLTTD